MTIPALSHETIGWDEIGDRGDGFEGAFTPSEEESRGAFGRGMGELGIGWGD